MRAFVGVKERIKDAELVIGGSGELIREYQSLAEQLGVSGSVNFIGFIEDKKLVRQYNACDVFVLPSIDKRQEGFGMVVLEAMACNKPVVVTDIVGVSEDVKKHKLGAVVRPGDTDGLSDAIIGVLNGKMRYKNREFVKKHYSWKKVGRAVSGLYDEILKR